MKNSKSNKRKKRVSEKNKKLYIFAGIVVVLLIIVLCWAFWPCSNSIPGQNNGNNNPGGYEVDKKPIIYIYPKEETNIMIKVSKPDNFIVTYPQYNNGWEVRALPDGTLIDKSNKMYYALYWEGKHYGNNKIKEDGFVVKGEEVASFLEEKLELLGLNYKEKEEFIVYWLPELEKNKYNYIRFQTMEEINNNMELFIEPKPDTLIRIMMEYKPLSEKIKVKRQELTKVERTGYTIVEWGGTKIN